MIVERTDFVSVPVTDVERATGFYRDTLGLEQVSEGGWPEFQLGENISLYLIDPTNLGSSFTGPHTAHIALRVPDVAAAKATLEAAGIEVNDMWDSGACKGASLNDPAGNRILLHRRYAPYGPR